MPVTIFPNRLFIFFRPNGVIFVASPGTTEFAKRWDPQKGDIVSFKHRGYMFGTKKPKLPVLYRLRPDLTWDDVVNSWQERVPHVTGTSLPYTLLFLSFFLSFINSSCSQTTALPLKRPTAKHMPKGYWLDINNRRDWFIKYADSNGFDYRNVETWANVSKRHVVEEKVPVLLS